MQSGNLDQREAMGLSQEEARATACSAWPRHRALS